MAAKQVESPDGRLWVVRRRWARRPELRRPDIDPFDLAHLAADDLVGLALSIVLVVAAVLFTVLLLPLLLFVFELLLFAFAAYALGRTWVVEISAGGAVVAQRKVRGYLQARRVMQQAALDLESGLPATIGPASD